MKTIVYKWFDPRVMESEERIGINRGLPAMPSYKTMLSAMKKRPNWRSGLFWEEQFSNILLSQYNWNLVWSEGGLWREWPYKKELLWFKFCEAIMIDGLLFNVKSVVFQL
jgi:hypothetical protein